jgi:hypothetical protein
MFHDVLTFLFGTWQAYLSIQYKNISVIYDKYSEFQVSRWSGTVTESILIVGIPEVMKIHSSRSLTLFD